MDDEIYTNHDSRSFWLLGVGLTLICVTWFGSQWFLQRAENQQPVVSALAQQYQELRSMSSSISGSWLRTLNPAVQNVQGGLVWNSETQTGVMRFTNLPNPAKGFRYHLWIHDSQGEREGPVSSTILEKGSGRNERYVNLETAYIVNKPYKFELVLEPFDGDGDPQILMMVQP